MATEVLKYGEQKATCISFLDINDTEVGQGKSQPQISDKIRKEVKAMGASGTMFKYSDTEQIFLIDGNGNHSIKEYSNGQSFLSLAVSSVITKALQNSIENVQSREFKPITREYLISDIWKLMQQAKEGKTPNQLIEELDNNLHYGDSKKISTEEAKLLDTIDELYASNIKLTETVNELNRQNSMLKEQMKAQDVGIQNNCSEITRYKIRVDSLRERCGTNVQWALGEKYTLEEIDKAKSDKEIVSLYLSEKESKKEKYEKPMIEFHNETEKISINGKVRNVNEVIEEIKDSEQNVRGDKNILTGSFSTHDEAPRRR